MKLIEARVENYKLIDDTTNFRIDDLTCLVGKNESGKTAVLKALHRLNPDDPDEKDFHVETEYPRHKLFEYEPRHQDHPDVVVTTRWELDDADAEWVEGCFGPGVLTSREATLEKRYNNRRYWNVSVDEQRAVANLVTDSDLDQVDAKKLQGIMAIQDLIQQVEGLDESSRKDVFLERLRNLVGTESVPESVWRHLSLDLPTFVYYANYHALPGKMSLEKFVQLDAENQLAWPEKIFKALLSLVGSSAEQISKTETYEVPKARLEAIGIQLSREIFEYWTQNRDLKVEFTFDIARPGDPPPFDSGYVFRTRIENTRHGVTVSFDERSTGFVWFFSFLVWFSQMQREHGDNLVLLLDEPGLSLQGTAQADLLRYINEKLVPKYQVIYTTHSPFMVDAGNILSVRTVEDVTIEEKVLGTKVGDDVLSTDAETLFPLRAALGYDITQTLFIGENSLCVEGPSDLLYLEWASEELRAGGRTALDRRWTITPCGGIRKIGSFLALFGAHGLRVAAFSDYAPGDKSEVRSLREKGLLRDGHVLTADMFVDGDEADIEDVVGRRLYVDLVNKAYALPAGHRLKATPAKDAPQRVIKEVEDHFKLLPADVPEFDHTTPARHLVENASTFREAPGTDAALDRFEELFKVLNGFLAS